MCRKQPGIAIGRLCDKCDGKCPVCDSYVRPTTLVRICDECSFGNYQNKCVVCGGEVCVKSIHGQGIMLTIIKGISDAFYCFECTRLEKDRDGCPKIINLGSSRTDLFYQYVHLHSLELNHLTNIQEKEFSKSLELQGPVLLSPLGFSVKVVHAARRFGQEQNVYGIPKTASDELLN